METDNLPIGTQKLSINCGLWTHISDDWCTNDYGDDWEILE